MSEHMSPMEGEEEGEGEGEGGGEGKQRFESEQMRGTGSSVLFWR